MGKVVRDEGNWIGEWVKTDPLFADPMPEHMRRWPKGTIGWEANQWVPAPPVN
jgi:hypothetical protein